MATEEVEPLIRRDPETKKHRLKRWLTIAGPGLVVMLADTEAGSLITAGETGARWGYSLVFLQLSLIPVLYLAQELAARISIVTGKGQAELIREHFGAKWAYFAVGCIIITCVGGLVSEISGIVGVGQMLNVSRNVSVLVTVAFFLGVVITGSYERVEKVALGVGLFELVFVVTMFLTWPSKETFVNGLTPHVLNADFLNMVAANVGSVVMPWMLFYQGSASVGKGISPADLDVTRIDTFVGACVTQLVMIGVIFTTAKSWDGHFPGQNDLVTVPQFGAKLGEIIGPFWGEALFAMGILGGALVGGIVVTLTATWAISEVSGKHHSLEHTPWETPAFYVGYVLILCTAAFVFSMFARNLVAINVGIQVMNAMFGPVCLCFLVLLGCKLPPEHRLQGGYKVLVIVAFSTVSAISLFSGIYALVA